ncbi:MAG: methyltransferase domain-containing protein [Bacteroidetes bacterium]|nr:methyltransferase domain-containing protein [Bacteroidota bacterium]
MIGKEIHDIVFRDTKDFYKSNSHEINVSRPIVRFIEQHAGKQILDFGCAIGNYSLHLSGKGYVTTGVDINEQYVKIAQSRGVNALHITGKTPFADKSFDTVIILEVLEHLSDPDIVLQEAKRLAKNNVLITTPNCNKIKELRNVGLLFEHFADKDHRNFFTQETMHELLLKHFSSVKVIEGNPINPLGLFHSPLIRRLGKVLSYTKILPAQYSYRLFAVAQP